MQGSSKERNRGDRGYVLSEKLGLIFRSRSPSPQRPSGIGSSSHSSPQESTPLATSGETAGLLTPPVTTSPMGKTPSGDDNIHHSSSPAYMNFANAHNISIYGGSFTDIQGNSNTFNGPVSIIGPEPGYPDLLQRLNAANDPLDRLCHEMVSYKTRHSSYGDPSGCMPGTCIQVLADLESWALNDSIPKVYWLVGMAGTGKSTISHSLCEILDARNMLGASFFCSRGSETPRNARLIIPTIAHSIASTSPSIKSEIIQAINEDPRRAEPTYINLEDQFNKFIRRPIKMSVSCSLRTYKVIVIDAVDEFSDLRFVSSLIRLILKLCSDVPLKLFIASRDEDLIHSAFYSTQELLTAFQLHEVEKHVVGDDIRLYIERSLLDIKSPGLDRTPDAWPAPFELSTLIEHSGRLFIYPATALRYIRDGGKLYKARLSDMANRDPKSGSKKQTSMIDDLYGHILHQACTSKEDDEITPMRQLLSIIIFLRNPLPIQTLTALAEIDADVYLSALTSVIHIPSQTEAAVAPFHASFPDFVMDPSRCSLERCPSFAALRPAKSHDILASSCLNLTNSSLRYNICGVSMDSTVSRQGRINSPDSMAKISEALKYSCVYWASHLAELQDLRSELVVALHHFLHKHLLHWIECLSILNELETGVRSLESINAALSRSKATDNRSPDLRSIVDDARRCLQTNFEAIQQNCFEIYQSAFVWLPKTSLIRKIHSADLYSLPKVVLGLHDTWASADLVLQVNSEVSAIALSSDGSQAVTASWDNIVRIWNTTTGLLEAELKGHAGKVTSVAFSGNKVVSGSEDRSVRIWDVDTGEIETELKGHTNAVTAVALSPDGSRLVSGSEDSTVRIWNTMTGSLEAKLRGHLDIVTSVSFSPDGSRVLSGSSDTRLRIWNAATGGIEVDLEAIGHMGKVMSAKFSNDGRRVVSGSQDGIVRIWDVTTRGLKAELKGHTAHVTSVMFSSDGRRVVSGSYDDTVRVWNAGSGQLEAELTGHTDEVWCVAFFPDGNQIISGSRDQTVRVWNTAAVDADITHRASSVTCLVFSEDGEHLASGSGHGTILIRNAMTGEVEVELKGHSDLVCSVAFSQDGSRITSGSRDETVRVWSTKSGRAEAEFRGHTRWLTTAVFSQDGKRVVSGSYDETARIWDVTTGKAVVELKSHSAEVWSVAFSLDGSRVVTGSVDKTIRIWNATTGDVERELTGHTDHVLSVAFSQDGSELVSASLDQTIRVWNIATGRSVIMRSRYLTLADRSEVMVHNWGGLKVFKIIYSVQQSTRRARSTCSISEDGRWILGEERDCWIPPHDRDIGEVVFSGSRTCWGYSTGRLVILDMNGRN